MSWVFFHNFLHCLGTNLFLEDIEIFCVENDDLVIFCDHKNFIFLDELAKCDDTFINFERVWFNPLALYNNLTSNIFLDFPQS